MLENPFSVLERRLNRLEFLLLEIKETTHTPSTTKDHLTIQEAAELLNVAVPTIYSWVGAKSIPFYKKQRRLYFSKADLNEWVKSGRKRTISEIADEAVQIVNKRRV